MNEIVVISRDDLKEMIVNTIRKTLVDFGIIKDECKPKYYTREELATVWNVSKATIWRFEKLGYIKSVRMGHKKLYEKALVDSLGIEGIQKKKSA